MFNFFKKKTTQETGEKRVSHRVKCDEVCLLEFETSKSQSKRLGKLKDISLSGMRFLTIFSLKKKESLSVTLFFSKKFYGVKKIQLTAEVARVYRPEHSDHYRVGCRFVDLSPENQEIIRQFVFWCDTEVE